MKGIEFGTQESRNGTSEARSEGEIKKEKFKIESGAGLRWPTPMEGLETSMGRMIRLLPAAAEPRRN